MLICAKPVLRADLNKFRPEHPAIGGKDYVQACLRSAGTDSCNYFLQGLTGELTELSEASEEEVKDELGDVLWYLVVFAYCVDEEYAYGLLPIFQDDCIDPLYAYTYTGGGMHTAEASMFELLRAAGRINEYFKKMSVHKKNMQGPMAAAVYAMLYQLAGIANMHGLALSDVAAANIEKLRRRYPYGFSVEASLLRADKQG